MSNALVLVIDDSPTIRKLVECHLSQAGYRVVMAADADAGVAEAIAVRPDLILLDHQLPGTTGDDVCRRLLENEATAHVPVIISSTLRNRAFAQYAEFPNVVDQVPKPFTPELLKGGVANALATGALVVKAQRSGCAVPEAVGEVRDPAFEGQTKLIGLRAVLDFLNNAQLAGRLTLEVGKDRVRFSVASGRIQAVTSPTIPPERLVPYLPNDLGDLAPLLAVTLAESQDASTAGLVKLLERSLSDPRRLRALLRTQAGILTYWSLTGELGRFSFEPGVVAPPMFQAFPLQLSLAALGLLGLRPCDPSRSLDEARVYARLSPRGGNLDRAGLSPLELKVLSLLDGSLSIGAVAERAGASFCDVADVVRAFELVGLAEPRGPGASAAVLAIEDNPDTARTIQRVLGPEGEGCRLHVVREAVAAQLLLRRNRFDLVLIAMDRPEQEALYRTLRDQHGGTARFVAIVGLEDESQVGRLDQMGFDGVLSRPLAEDDLRATFKHLGAQHDLAAAS